MDFNNYKKSLLKFIHSCDEEDIQYLIDKLGSSFVVYNLQNTDNIQKVTFRLVVDIFRVLSKKQDKLPNYLSECIEDWLDKQELFTENATKVLDLMQDLPFEKQLEAIRLIEVIKQSV